MLVMGTKEKSKKKEEEEAVADKRIQNDLCRMSELIDQQNVLYDAGMFMHWDQIRKTNLLFKQLFAAPSKKLQITGWEPVNDRSLGIPESLSSSQPLSPGTIIRVSVVFVKFRVAPSEKAISTLYTSQESFGMYFSVSSSTYTITEKLSRADTIGKYYAGTIPCN